MNKSWYWTCSLMMAGQVAFAQEKEDSLSTIQIEGYIETYYQYNPDRPTNHQKVGFIYSHNRVNELSVNLALVKLSYQKDRVRSTIGLAAGSYMNANYAAEEGVWKHVYEANVGYKLLKEADLWFDAGVLPSHIGPESAIGADNISMTRSIAAENSPYFETGARLSYSSPDSKWYIAALALNGWQRIQLTEDQQGMSFGHQLQYKPVPNLTLNSSSYFGNEAKNSFRFFHDFYAQWAFDSGLTVLGSWDYGQQKIPEIVDNSHWWNAGLQLRYAWNERWAMNGRREYFDDSDGLIFGTGDPTPKTVWGSSIGLDYSPFAGLLWRMEYRYLKAEQGVFTTADAQQKTYNHGINASLSWKF